MKKQKDHITRAFHDLLTLIFFVIIGYIGALGILEPTTSALMFFIGFTLAIFIQIVMLLDLYNVQFRKRNLIKNEQAIIYAVAVGFTTLTIFAILYFVLAQPAYMIMDLMEPMYDWPTNISGVFTLYRNVYAWCGVLVLFDVLLWIYVYSQREDALSAQYGY